MTKFVNMKKVILILAIILASCSSDDDSIDYALPCECWEITNIEPYLWEDGEESIKIEFLKDCVEERFSIHLVNDINAINANLGDCYNEIFM